MMDKAFVKNTILKYCHIGGHNTAWQKFRITSQWFVNVALNADIQTVSWVLLFASTVDPKHNSYFYHLSPGWQLYNPHS